MRLRTFSLLAVLLAQAVTIAGARQRSATIAVPGGGNLQEAINNARPGDTILLDAGATYVGNFVLPAKEGSQFITIRTAPRAGQPGNGERVSPDDAGTLAKLRSPNTQAALRTAARAHHWRLELLEFMANDRGSGDIILLGDGSSAQNDLGDVPFELVVDRCLVRGDPQLGQKRGIALNSASTAVTNSYISDIKAVGQDSQALGGWNGPGPYLIENNYLEAAGENFLMGGSDPAIRNLIPSDITFRRNHLSKPEEWRRQRWQVKNLFELKNARRVLVEGNLMEKNWHAAQTGFAIVLTPRNSGGRAPWSTVEDVTFRFNVVRHVAAVFNILGEDNTDPSGRLRRVVITDNLFAEVDHRQWGGNGAFLQIGDGPADVRVEHNTIIHTGNVISAYGGTKSNPVPIVGFTYRNNLSRHNSYGVFGSSRAYGSDSLATFFPGAAFTHNVLAGGRASRYPAGNMFPAVEEFQREFVDYADGDYRLAPNSRYRGAASDGGDLGANLADVEKIAGERAVRDPRGKVPRRRIPR
jgi:hypothetical protein